VHAIRVVPPSRHLIPGETCVSQRFDLYRYELG
jgi:hypothetical protein